MKESRSPKRGIHRRDMIKGTAAEPAKFASGIVDIGMVAKDLEKTAKFYTEVVGLKEVKGFEASAEKATAFGLTDNQPAKVRMWDSSIL